MLALDEGSVTASNQKSCSAKEVAWPVNVVGSAPLGSSRYDYDEKLPNGSGDINISAVSAFEEPELKTPGIQEFRTNSIVSMAGDAVSANPHSQGKLQNVGASEVGGVEEPELKTHLAQQSERNYPASIVGNAALNNPQSKSKVQTTSSSMVIPKSVSEVGCNTDDVKPHNCSNDNDVSVCVNETLEFEKSSSISTVSPASVNENDILSAVRWKSYIVNAREASRTKSAIDTKSKLVINLSSNTGTFIKVSPAASVAPVNNSDSLNSSYNVVESFQEASVVEGVGDVERFDVAKAEAGEVTLGELARKVRLRIKRHRVPAKPFNLPLETFVESMPNVGAQDGDIVNESLKESLSKSLALPEKCQIQPLVGSVHGETLVKETNVDCPSTDDTAVNVHVILEDAKMSVDDLSNVNELDDVVLCEKVDTESEQAISDANMKKMCEEILGAQNANADSIAAVKGADHYEPSGSMPVIELTAFDNNEPDKEETFTEYVHQSRDNKLGQSSRAPSVSCYDNGTTSETSKFDLKDQTILDTLLPDEVPGYSSGGCTEPSRMQVPKRGSSIKESETTYSYSDTEDTDSSSESDGYDEEESLSEESEDANENATQNCLSQDNHRGVASSEQVPSVLCDAEGNVWHIGKRAEQARATKVSHPVEEDTRRELPKESHGAITTSFGCVPYNHLIQFNWRWPSDADYTFGIAPDATNRTMIMKERSIFVGCIPDGVDHLEEQLQSLMEKFLERFDFAPASLGHVHVVKAVKDFAFLELAAEKVVQIVLAANQLDVFEWGVNGYHLNIQGCSGTHSSVRPLIEYLPLKPSRVISVSNIPKSRWQKEYLEAFFARLLKGVDGTNTSKHVLAVYLLPESCDAYVELSSDLMAESLIYKCTKNPQLLKDIGEDVFICRDASSIPMMSRHKGTVDAQRSLFIGFSPRGEEFKIESIRKVFDEILPCISRELNQPGYLEYIYILPGKDYAFFQFNSEATVDAIMDEYIVNTQLFACKINPVPYIILRPPDYIRPGAKLNRLIDQKGETELKHRLLKKRGNVQTMPNMGGLEQAGKIFSKAPRRFGDEPIKKSDCLMSVGATAPPCATWNGMLFAGVCSADPDSMLIVEGLPKGLSYKLARGALNELFERSLCRTGLLDVGMLVLRYLDRDSNLDVVASLPNPNFTIALLTIRRPFSIAGNKIRFLPKESRGIPRSIEMGNGQGDHSCLTDEDAGQVRHFHKFVDERNGIPYADVKRRKHTLAQGGQLLASMKGLVRKQRSSRSSLRQLGIKAHIKEMQRLQNATLKKHAGSKVLQGPVVAVGKGSILQGMKSGGLNFKELPKHVLKIVAKEDRREVQCTPGPLFFRAGVGDVVTRLKKRKIGQGNPGFTFEAVQQRFKRTQFTQI